MFHRFANAGRQLSAAVVASTLLSVSASSLAADERAQRYFQPPEMKDLPNNEFGASVKRGYDVFTETGTYARDYVGNGMRCANCHLDSGRAPNAAPLWAAWVAYPAYRKKNGHVNTMEERIQGCFTYSMNAQASKIGHAPASGSAVLVDLQSYMYWLATGAPTGANMQGRGFPKLAQPKDGYDPKRGAEVFAQHCAMCHGADGQGTKANGRYVFPPLWGPDSFNWGAGMHRVDTAAAFIKANMPFGKPNSLTDQEAWDVAAFVDSHERPQDPRYTGDVAETAEKHHKHAGFYGRTVDGTLIGQGIK